MSEKRLARVSQNRMVFGVASGIANYFSIDPTVVRVLFVVGTLLSGGGPGLVAYLIMLLLMPEDGEMPVDESFDPDEIIIKDID